MNRWSDQPYYARANDEIGSKMTKYLPLTSFKGYDKSAKYPSSLLIWHMEEDRKRKNHEPNEHDYNEIKAAIKGFKNKWFKVVHTNLELFNKPFNELNWDNIFEMKDKF